MWGVPCVYKSDFVNALFASSYLIFPHLRPLLTRTSQDKLKTTLLVDGHDDENDKNLRIEDKTTYIGNIITVLLSDDLQYSFFGPCKNIFSLNYFFLNLFMTYYVSIQTLQTMKNYIKVR